MIDNQDIITLRATMKELESITQKLCNELKTLGSLKASLAVQDSAVKSLIEQKKFLEEDIRVQKKTLDNLPK